MQYSIPTIEHFGDNEPIDRLLPQSEDEVECSACGNVWVAVKPLGYPVTGLECPKCYEYAVDYHEPANVFVPARTEH